jgi:hypothetical protein
MRYVTALLVLLLMVPAHAEETAQSVVECMRTNLPPSLRVQDFEMVSTDRAGGSRRLGGKLYAKAEDGLLRLTLRVLDPPDLYGSAYLLRETPGNVEDQIYLQLPKDTPRRITGGQASQSLFGTDFSYADVKQMQNTFSGGEGKLEAPAEVDKRPVHVLLQKAQPAKGVPYSQTRVWVDQKTCVVLKAEFFEGDKPRKRLTAPASALTQADKHWYASEMEMRDLKEETHTVLKVKVQPSEKDLSQHYFSPNTFGIIAK